MTGSGRTTRDDLHVRYLTPFLHSMSSADIVRRTPARRVLYRSQSVRWLRLAVGICFGALCAYLIAPAITTEPPPPSPPPVGLFVGTNTWVSGPGTLQLSIRAAGCRNPVVLEGMLNRSQRAWGPDPYRPTVQLPTTAVVALVGAHVRRIEMGLGISSNEQVHLPPSERTGAFSQPPFAISRKYMVTNSNPERFINVHSTTTAPLIEGIEKSQNKEVHPPWAGMMFHSSQWPLVRVPLRFVILADLVHLGGYNRCYVDVPQLFSSHTGVSEGFYDKSNLLIGKLSVGELYLRNRYVLTDGIPWISEVSTGIVDVTTTGRSPAPSTIEADGKVSRGGIHYECRVPRPSPSIGAEESNLQYPELTAQLNCSGEPQFEAQGIDADITSRLFFGGIIGALAATLIIETIFAETETGAVLLARKRRRSARRKNKPGRAND